MKLESYFWGWLVEAHLCGYLTDDDIIYALEDHRAAYQILMECFDESLAATGKMAQEYLRELQKFVVDRKNNLDTKPPILYLNRYDNIGNNP